MQNWAIFPHWPFLTFPIANLGFQCFWCSVIRLTSALLTFGFGSVVSDNCSHLPLLLRTLNSWAKTKPYHLLPESTGEDLKRLLQQKKLQKVIPSDLSPKSRNFP